MYSWTKVGFRETGALREGARRAVALGGPFALDQGSQRLTSLRVAPAGDRVINTSIELSFLQEASYIYQEDSPRRLHIVVQKIFSWSNAPPLPFVLKQGCGVGVRAGVGVARSRGNEPGVGVGVGVDQTASTPTPECFICICDVICLYRGEFASTWRSWPQTDTQTDTPSTQIVS